MTLRTLDYGNYGIFLIMGNAGFCPSTVSGRFKRKGSFEKPFKDSIKDFLNLATTQG